MFNKILLVPKIGGANIDKAVALIEDIKSANEWNGRFEIISDVDDADDKTIAVPVGGDGTVLYCAKQVVDKGIPIMGFNLGQVGFLTDLPNTTEAMLMFLTKIGDHFAENRFREDKRTLLSVWFGGTHHLAMNDFVISDVYSDSIINYELNIGGSYAGSHKANSVIVATPTGSTAYAMWVGGSIIEPDLDVMEIIPVAAMSMSTRPIIVSGDSEIEIKILVKEGRTASLKSDGQWRGRIESSDTTISIKRYEKKVTLLHYDDWNFFERLSNKLSWNK